MFSEDQFIEDFIDINIHNTRFILLDLEDVRIEIQKYGDKKLASYSINQLKYITELYYSYDEIKKFQYISDELYKELATFALYRLFPKIMIEYIDQLNLKDDEDIDHNFNNNIGSINLID